MGRPYHFGARSLANLSTCDERIQEVLFEVITIRDCAVLCGRRPKEEQDRVFREGHSRVEWPDSRHNVVNPDDLAEAVDVVPWYAAKPHIRWNDREGFVHFAGVVLGVAGCLGVPLRWGGNWDGDQELLDQSFFDLPHFEILEGVE